jgi:hypothetical protein
LRRLLALCALLCLPTQALAFIQPGAKAPDFIKNQLVGGAMGPAWSLYGQAPKVVILFVLGYS